MGRASVLLFGSTLRRSLQGSRAPSLPARASHIRASVVDRVKEWCVTQAVSKDAVNTMRQLMEPPGMCYDVAQGQIFFPTEIL